VVRPFVKFAARIDTIARMPFLVEKALRTAVAGRPGPVYLDIPADMLESALAPQDLPHVGTPLFIGAAGARATLPLDTDAKQISVARPLSGASHADPLLIKKTLELLQSAKKPLVIIGKGVSYARAEVAMRKFIGTLPTLSSSVHGTYR
jgi:2-hydroxyacyl-CoA lyase 1